MQQHQQHKYVKYVKAQVCYTDTDSFIIHIITEDFFEDISNDVEAWYDTSNYDENDKRPLPIGKNKKVIALFKDELGLFFFSILYRKHPF